MSTSEIITRTPIEVSRELKRKSLHLPGLLVPVFYQWLPKLTLLTLGAMSLLYYISEVRRISHASPIPIISTISQTLTRSDHLDWAPIYLSIGLGFSAAFLPFKAAMCGALLVCFGDAVAAVVGLKFGRKKIFFTKKTYRGSLAFFISSLLVLIPLLGFPGALITAFAATIIEVFSIEGIDNLLLPILGGGLANILT